MNTADVLEQFEEAKQTYSVKDSDCDKRIKYMRGEYYNLAYNGSTLRDEVKSSISDEHYTALNLPRLAVVDSTNLCASDPDIVVPPKDDKSEEKARKMERVYRGIYETSGGTRWMRDSTYGEILHGWGVVGALPNLPRERVDLVYYNARYCYPTFKFGSKTFLTGLYVAWMEKASTIRREFDNTGVEGSDEVEVMIAYTEDADYTFVDKKFVKGVRHERGFVPFVVIPFEPIDGAIGMGLADQEYGLNILINENINLRAKWVHDNVHSDTHLATDDEEPDVFKMGNRTVWKTSSNSRIERVAPTVGNLQDAAMIARELTDYANTAGAQSAARQGQREGMYVSSAYSELSRGLGDKLDAYRSCKGSLLALAFEYAARLSEKHFKNKVLNIYGRGDDNRVRAHNYKGSIFNGYYRVDVTWPPTIMSSANNWVTQWLQFNGAGLASNYTTQTKLGNIIKDPLFEKKQIEEERFAQAKLEAAVQRILMEATQQAAPPELPQPGVQNPDDVEFEARQLEKGRTNETANGMFGRMSGRPPLQLVGSGGATGGGGPMPMSPLSDGGGGMPPVDEGSFQVPQENQLGAQVLGLEEVVQTIAAIPKLKGDVFLVGAIVHAGSIDLGSDQQLEFFLSDMLDKTTIINTIKKSRPELDGRMAFYKLEGSMPAEPHVHASEGNPQIMGGGTYGGDSQLRPGAVPAGAGAAPIL